MLELLWRKLVATPFGVTPLCCRFKFVRARAGAFSISAANGFDGHRFTHRNQRGERAVDDQRITLRPCPNLIETFEMRKPQQEEGAGAVDGVLDFEGRGSR